MGMNIGKIKSVFVFPLVYLLWKIPYVFMSFRIMFNNNVAIKKIPAQVSSYHWPSADEFSILQTNTFLQNMCEG